MATQLFDLTGKVAVVTGGTGALGAAMCLGLASAGAIVVVMARRQGPIDDVVNQIREAGGQATGISADATDKAALEAATQHVVSEHGRVDVLVNGAGGNKPEATAVPGQHNFFDLPSDALQWVLDLNLMSAVLASQVFGQQMAQQESGVIVNISSMASLKILTRVVAYSAAKAAVNNFTQWLAVYMAREHSPNIRVNAIAPGFYLGEQNRFLLIDQETGDLTARGSSIIQTTPMGRFGDPDDLVGPLVWLCSDASRFVTGIVVPVDGGFSAFSGI
jgi:NAD(P)-dependent dehydrogenase (short-subunit alcohol dehydrogenase family)